MVKRRKKVCFTKAKPFEENYAEKLIKKKKRDVYIKDYNLEEFRKTIYSDQTDQFSKQFALPLQRHHGHGGY